MVVMGKSYNGKIHIENLGVYLIGMSFILALILEVIINMYFTERFVYLFTLHWIVLLVRDISLVVMVLSIIVFGVRSIRLFHFNIYNLIIICLGGLLAITFAYIKYVDNVAIINTKQAITIDLRKVEDRIDRHLFRHNTLMDKLQGSKEFAQAVYNETGKRIDVLVAEEAYEKFEPSKIDIKNYKEKQFHLSVIEKVNVLFPIYLWLSVVLCAFFIGIFTPTFNKLHV